MYCCNSCKKAISNRQYLGSGLCTKCRKHLNYQKNKDELVARSKIRWQNKKQNRPLFFCSICSKQLNVNNKTLLCNLHYKQTVSKDKKRQYNQKSYSADYYINRYKRDVDFRLRTVMRARLRAAIKGKMKNGSAIRDLGCSIEDLKFYLESRFQPGMTWENYGEWHIDHVIPLSSFDLTDSSEFKKACHYSNLQPLWAEDNLKKSNKLK